MPVPLKEPDFIQDMYTVSVWEDVNAALKSPHFKVGRELQISTRENILLLINGKEHLERRQIESPIFQRDALAEYEKLTLRPLLDSYVERWRTLGQAELVHETLMILVRIGALLTGVTGVETDSVATEILGYVDVWSAAGSVEYSRLPEDGKQAIVKSAERSVQEFDRKYVTPMRIATLKMMAGKDEHAEGSPDGSSRNLIAELLAHWNPEWSPELLTLEVLAYLAGSVRTSMRAVCNSVDEISGWVDAHPEDESLLDDPAFIRQAVNETLRLHVVAPVLLRVTDKETVLPSGLTIPGDAYVAILYARANRDQRQFGPDADEFDPHRAERQLTGRDYGLSFAAGAHACIGRRLAVGAAGEGEGVNNGTVMTLVERLMHMRAAPDPDDPPRELPHSFYDEFARYPIRFTR